MRMNRGRFFRYLLLLALGVIYLASGIYSLKNGQHALILRFGKVVAEVSDSGSHYHLPAPFETVIKGHMSKVHTLPLQTTEFLVEQFTGDENLLVVQALVSYDIKELQRYCFHVENIPALIQAAGQNCLSQQLASIPVDEVMTSGKSILRLVMKENIQTLLDQLESGVRVISVELTNISPPEDVAQAFKAVSDARVKKQRLIKEAEGYVNVVLPENRGKVSAILAQSRAYAKEVEHFTQGRVNAFYDILTEYQRSPEITSRLKYLDTLKEIGQKSRILIDADPQNNTYYIQQPPNMLD